MQKQITSEILMVRPANFGFNPETAENNVFQKDDHSMTANHISDLARKEFDGFVKILKKAGIVVIVFEEPQYPTLTDSVFPNNWFSTHENGVLVTYPMFSSSRQLERRTELLSLISNSYQITERLQLEHYEKKNIYLEGTGSLILDRSHRVAYACRSIRTNEKVLDDFCSRMNYKKVLFDSSDESGTPIYHTNVMMCIGETFTIICLESIRNRTEREQVVKNFKNSHKEIISISMSQVNQFAGNMLQVYNKSSQKYLVMSTSAHESLTKDQLKKIKKHADILHFPIPTIEKYGGGSVRCMMAEIFLPLAI